MYVQQQSAFSHALRWVCKDGTPGSGTEENKQRLRIKGINLLYQVDLKQIWWMCALYYQRQLLLLACQFHGLMEIWTKIPFSVLLLNLTIIAGTVSEATL